MKIGCFWPMLSYAKLGGPQGGEGPLLFPKRMLKGALLEYTVQKGNFAVVAVQDIIA